MNDRIDDYVASVPVSAQGIVGRAMRREGGRTNAIRAACLSCCHFDRDVVRNCAVWRCPLHPWRPYQNAAENEPVSEAAT